MGKDQDIRLKIEAAGAEKAAGDVGKVDAAQKGLTDQTIDAKKPTEDLDAATTKLTASEEDYVSILSRVHPSLGAMADVMLKGSKVVGDLAAQEINLTAVTARATAALASHKDTLKLLAAGGAVVAGIGAVIPACERLAPSMIGTPRLSNDTRRPSIVYARQSGIGSRRSNGCLILGAPARWAPKPRHEWPATLRRS